MGEAGEPAHRLVAAVVALLDGLADAVGAQEFDERLAAVLDAGVAGDRAADLVAAARRAHDGVHHRRERESELGALYATARDLVALRDVDATLQAVVHRAQQVLPGADTTYLCLKDDESGGFYVLASVGLISPEFKKVIVPPGRGMSAHIERTRSAMRVRRYLDDPTVEHDEGLDDALAADGLTSIVGTPLIARDRMLGVLFAANRRERAFSDEETALLTALADAAGLAIDNARLFEEVRQAQRTAETDNQALRRSAELHDRLTRLVLHGAEVAEVLDALADVFSGTLALYGRDDHLVAHRGRSAVPARPDPALASALVESRRSGRSVAVPDARRPAQRAAAVAAGSSYLGALVLAHDEPITAMDARNLERAAQIVSLLTLQQNAQIEAEERVRGELLVELLSTAGPLPEVVRLRAQQRHLDLEAPLAVAVVRVGDPEKVGVARRRLGDIAALDGGLAGEFGGHLVYLGPCPDGSAALVTDVHQRLGRGGPGPVIVCAAPPAVAATGELPRAHHRAQQAIGLLVALGRTDTAVTTDDLLLFNVLFDPSRGAELDAFVTSAIGPLLANDRDQGSELVATLREFFECGGNAARTARELHVHPNTVVKRLDRIGSLLGPDWQLERRSLSIRVALQLHALGDPRP